MSDVLDDEIDDVRCIYSADSQSVEDFNKFFVSFLEAEYTKEIFEMLRAKDHTLHYGTYLSVIVDTGLNTRIPFIMNTPRASRSYCMCKVDD